MHDALNDIDLNSRNEGIFLNVKFIRLSQSLNLMNMHKYDKKREEEEASKTAFVGSTSPIFGLALKHNFQGSILLLKNILPTRLNSTNTA